MKIPVCKILRQTTDVSTQGFNVLGKIRSVFCVLKFGKGFQILCTKKFKFPVKESEIKTSFRPGGIRVVWFDAHEVTQYLACGFVERVGLFFVEFGNFDVESGVTKIFDQKG